MDERLTKVVCSQMDCTYWQDDPEDGPNRVWCTHSDKPHYLHRSPCPLFRINVRSRMEAGGPSPADLLKMIRRR